MKESVSLSSDGEEERGGYDVVVGGMVNVVMERSIGVSADDWVMSLLTRCPELSTVMGRSELSVAVTVLWEAVLATRESRLSLREDFRWLSRAGSVATSAVGFSSALSRSKLVRRVSRLRSVVGWGCSRRRECSFARL